MKSLTLNISGGGATGRVTVLLGAVWAVFVLGACNAEVSGSEPETQQRESALAGGAGAGGASPAYTELTASERAEAEQHPWERDAANHQRPPQHVVDFFDGNSRANPQPHPDAAQRLEDFEAAWANEKQRLRNAGMSDQEIKEERSKFKFQKLVQEVQ